jgi:LPXTG-motif cell wall-anchored protein
VKNTGDVPLYDITLTDDVIGDIALTDNSLDPDETVTATDTYIAEEVGELTNTATAMGKYTIGNDECEVTDTAEFTVIITEAPVLTGNVKIIKRKTPWNYEMPELMSLSDSPGLPHEYVTFRLTQVEGELTFEGETDNDGILEFNGIPVGDYVLEEEVPEGYEFDYWCGDINEDNVISVNDNTTAVIFVFNRELPKGTIKVVKTLNERNGEPQKDVPFELKRYRFDEEEQILASYTEEDGWPWIEYTDEEGEILFDGLECEGYYYTLREIGMEDYDVEYQDLYGDLVDVEKIQTWPGEGPTIYVINTPKGGEEPGGDDEPPSGGGGSRRRRPRTVEEEPVEVPEEPEVLTPPVAEEPVEEPVVVEEPMVTAPVLPALPHTGGNPAAFVIAGAALAGLGLYVRKRR